MKKPEIQERLLHIKTVEIQAKAKALQKRLPTHLKLVPEIKQTLSLVNDISEVLVCLAENITTEKKGDNHHAND